ncbi:hypothetical protein [Streptosporangium sp. NPDC000509]
MRKSAGHRSWAVKWQPVQVTLVAPSAASMSVPHVPQVRVIGVVMR